MHQRCDFLYVLLKKPERIRIGHHDAGNRIIQKRLQVRHIHKTGTVGLHLHDLQATDCRRCRISPMGTVRNNYACTPEVPAAIMVAADYHQPCKLPVRTGKWSESETCHSCDFRQGTCQITIKHECTLHRRSRLKRMQTGKLLHRGNLLINLRIILHRTASQWIKTGIHSEVHLRQVGIVPYNIRLAHLRKTRPG